VPAGIGLVTFALLVWGSDQLTWQDERTIYTVACSRGAWHADRCDGRLVRGHRYRFQAVRSSNQVLYRNIELPTVAGSLSECVITDGRNWRCNVTANAAADAMPLQMRLGVPVPSTASGTVPLHAVPKWRWWLLSKEGA
jgi:hypothetical protein